MVIIVHVLETFCNVYCEEHGNSFSLTAHNRCSQCTEWVLLLTGRTQVLSPECGVAPHNILVWSGTTHRGTPIWLSETSNCSYRWRCSWPLGPASWSSRFYLLHQLPTLDNLTAWHEMTWWATTIKVHPLCLFSKVASRLSSSGVPFQYFYCNFYSACHARPSCVAIL